MKRIIGICSKLTSIAYHRTWPYSNYFIGSILYEGCIKRFCSWNEFLRGHGYSLWRLRFKSPIGFNARVDFYFFHFSLIARGYVLTIQKGIRKNVKQRSIRRIRQIVLGHKYSKIILTQVGAVTCDTCPLNSPWKLVTILEKAVYGSLKWMNEMNLHNDGALY